MHTRVFLVEDHDIIRQGIADRIATEPDLEVVGSAASMAETLTKIAELPGVPEGGPMVAVIDLRLPDGNGVELCRELRSRHPGVRCVFLTSSDADDALFSTVVSGADGYVLKQMVGFELGRVVRAVGAGEPMLDDRLLARGRARVQRQRERVAANGPLTAPEPEVLDLVVAGHTNREIADTLQLPEETVRDTVSSVLTKLDRRLIGGGVGSRPALGDRSWLRR